MKFKSAKSVLSQYNEYKLEDGKIELLHRVLLHILKDFKACCERHNLKYMLCGGSCLGAVRHNGFIPWDDDADVMMPREDFDKVGQAIIDDYGDKYSLGNAKENHILNIMLNGTVYDEIWNAAPNRRMSIFLDIYPIDNMPKGKKRFRSFRFYWAKHANAFILDYKYPSEQIKALEKQDKSVRSYYRKRRFLGWLFNAFGGFNHYNNVVDKLARYKKETGYLGIPCAIAYNREKFRAEVLTETIDAQFCGETFCIPKFYDEYLTNLYGSDYMTLPPPEKREIHVTAKIDFGKYARLNEKGEFDE
ncbi:MAG: LicD family protein [Clostridia bacterium]|nr:LicD family protein [Clostridia bacterium]